MSLTPINAPLESLLTWRNDITWLDWGDLKSRLDTETDLTLDSIRRLPGHIVINTTYDAFDPQELFEDTLKYRLDRIGDILVNDPNLVDQNPSLNYRYFPFFLLKAISITDPGRDNLVDWQSRHYLLSCMNRHARPHRYLIYWLLRRMTWQNQMYLSFGNFKAYNTYEVDWDAPQLNLEEITGTFQYMVHPDFNFVEFSNFYQNEITRFPWTTDPQYNWVAGLPSDDYSLSGTADCYVNLVTETSMHFYCPTEKLLKAIQAGCLVAPAACQGDLAKLQTLGFDFDYTGFDILAVDSITDWVDRSFAVTRLVDQVSDQIPEIWNTNLDRLRYNQSLFRSGELLQQCQMQIQDLLAG